MNANLSVVRNPKDRKWYVVAACGAGYRMPVSSGYARREEAVRAAIRTARAEKAQGAELRSV